MVTSLVTVLPAQHINDCCPISVSSGKQLRVTCAMQGRHSGSIPPDLLAKGQACWVTMSVQDHAAHVMPRTKQERFVRLVRPHFSL